MKFLASLVSHSRQPARRPQWPGYPSQPEVSPPHSPFPVAAPAQPDGNRQTAVPARSETQAMTFSDETTAAQTPSGAGPQAAGYEPESPAVDDSQDGLPRVMHEPVRTQTEAIGKPQGFPAPQPPAPTEMDGSPEIRTEPETPGPVGRSQPPKISGETAMDGAGEGHIAKPVPVLNESAVAPPVSRSAEGQAVPPSQRAAGPTAYAPAPVQPAAQDEVATLDHTAPDQEPGQPATVPEAPSGEPRQPDRTRQPMTEERVQVRAEPPRQPATPPNPLTRRPVQPAAKPEIPQVRIGQINVLVEDQAPAKAQPRSAAARPTRANPFGLRGL